MSYAQNVFLLEHPGDETTPLYAARELALTCEDIANKARLIGSVNPSSCFDWQGETLL